jgi:hypothetical protein
VSTWIDRARALRPSCIFAPPATQEALADLEVALGAPLPDDLRELLLESNGIADDDGRRWVFGVERIRQKNAELRAPKNRAHHMPLDSLLFFAAVEERRDLFGLALGRIRDAHPPVFVYLPRDDSRVHVADSLDAWLESRLSGKFDP